MLRHVNVPGWSRKTGCKTLLRMPYKTHGINRMYLLSARHDCRTATEGLACARKLTCATATLTSDLPGMASSSTDIPLKFGVRFVGRCPLNVRKEKYIVTQHQTCNGKFVRKKATVPNSGAGTQISLRQCPSRYMFKHIKRIIHIGGFSAEPGKSSCFFGGKKAYITPRIVYSRPVKVCL